MSAPKLKSKYGAPSGGMVAQRRKHVEGIIYSRCGPVLPDDDAGREYLDEILRLTQDDLLCRKAKKLAPWMQEDERARFVARIHAMTTASRLASTVELGQRLRFENEERERLGAWQVRPHDYSDEDMAALAKAKKRLREETRRRKSGAVSRAEYLAKSLSRLKPWETEGVSRRTWERRRKKAVASPCLPQTAVSQVRGSVSVTLPRHAVATTADSGRRER